MKYKSYASEWIETIPARILDAIYFYSDCVETISVQAKPNACLLAYTAGSRSIELEIELHINLADI
jgi:hypothetical protein